MIKNVTGIKNEQIASSEYVHMWSQLHFCINVYVPSLMCVMCALQRPHMCNAVA